MPDSTEQKYHLTKTSYRESIVNAEQAGLLTCNSLYRPSHLPEADSGHL